MTRHPRTTPSRTATRFASTLVGLAAWAAIAFSASAALAHTNPPSCFATGPTLLLSEFRDTNMDNIGDDPIGGAKIEGETIYYQAFLQHSGTTQCGYQGGQLCIDPPGPGGCIDVTPMGGVPLLCSPPTCNPLGVAEVASQQLSYIVHAADSDGSCTIPTEIRARAFYTNGTSHLGNDQFPLNADTPICNPVFTPTPTATPTATPTPTPTPTPTITVTPTPLAPLHFNCYEVHHGPFARIQVTLDDRYQMSSGTVGVPKRICNPADKNDEDPAAVTNPNHLVSYKLKASPNFNRIPSVSVTNQFGTITLDVVKPEYLLVPGAKSLTGPAVPIVPTVNHFTCYRIARARFRTTNIKVDDQFADLFLDIKKPLRLCIPTDKNGGGTLDPQNDLLCYKVRTTPGTPKFTGVPDIFVHNQFGPDSLEVRGVRELCVPSTALP